MTLAGMKADHQRSATPVDWDRVWQRLDAVREAVAGVPSAVWRQQILHERARALAVDPQAALAAGACIEVLEFMIAGERHAGLHKAATSNGREGTPYRV